MKFLIKSIITLLLAAVFTTGAEAQIFKKLKDKAQEKLERKAEQKMDEEMEKAADKMVDNSWDAVFGSFDGLGDSPFAMSNNVTTEEVYDFDVVATMEIKSEKANGKTEPPMYMDMHFKEDVQYTGTKFRGEQTKQVQGDFFIIYDLKNSAMVMLMESEKDKFSFAYDWKQAIAAGEQVEEEMKKAGYEEEIDNEETDAGEMEMWGNYEKIGGKTIAGYSCDGYRSENQQQIVEIWVTKDADFGMQNMFQANANAKQLKGKLPEDYPNGMMMKMNMENLETGDKVLMEVKDINTNAKVRYAMADYPKMGFDMKDKGN
jgi:hypothetical protein